MQIKNWALNCGAREERPEGGKRCAIGVCGAKHAHFRPVRGARGISLRKKRDRNERPDLSHRGPRTVCTLVHASIVRAHRRAPRWDIRIRQTLQAILVANMHSPRLCGRGVRQDKGDDTVIRLGHNQQSPEAIRHQGYRRDE